MDRISKINYRAGFAKSPCAWIAVNEIPIEIWCAKEFDYPDASCLGFAQMWLYDTEEEKLAWSRLKPSDENSSTIVPILVCSDDMNFRCIVIVIEQLIVNETVQWLRWGHSISVGLEVGISTKWETPKKTPLAIFNRREFDACLREFGCEIPNR